MSIGQIIMQSSRDLMYERLNAEHFFDESVRDKNEHVVSPERRVSEFILKVLTFGKVLDKIGVAEEQDAEELAATIANVLESTIYRYGVEFAARQNNVPWMQGGSLPTQGASHQRADHEGRIR